MFIKNRYITINFGQLISSFLLVAVSIFPLFASGENFINVGGDVKNLTAPSVSKHVLIHLRVVRAKCPRKEGKDLQALRVSKGLADLSSKFEHLPFRSFETVINNSLLIPLKQKQIINLVDGHKVTFRPLEIRSNGDLSLWINWKDKQGILLLDSRVYVPYKETVLVGVEQSPTMGVVLVLERNN